MERKLAEQHRRLDALFDHANEVMRSARPLAAARELMLQLAKSLDTHLEQEERLYFPTIGALHPTQKPRLASCVAAHDLFRSELRQLEVHLEREDREAATRALESLIASFSEHEAVEEAMLAELEGEGVSAR